MNEKTTELWLRAIRAPGLAGGTLVRALDAAGSIEQLVRGRSSETGLSAATHKALKSPEAELIEADLEWLSGPRRTLLTWEDEDFPALLRRIPSPPTALFIEGDVNALWQPQVAVIGSRNPTAGGLDHARAFATELVRRGMTITSGMALGIDGAAHSAALESGGNTIAVCGCGLDIVYPQRSRQLHQDIPSNGALVSEFPTGFPPRREHFPSRNRIISGLSLGVLVVEAGLNSGTLITARQAAEQGRDVFALPGSLHNPMVKGCHRLIREGARLVESVQDILAELSPVASELAEALKGRLDASTGDAPAPSVDPDAAQLTEDEDYRKLWDALAYDPRTVEDLVGQTGLQAREVSSMLLMLELKGLITTQAGGRFAKSR